MTSYVCDLCNKSYKHRQSLSIHKKKCIGIKNELNLKFCNQNVTQMSPSCNPNVTLLSPSKIDSVEIHQKQENNNLYQCDYCDKTYKYRQGKSRHQKNCKAKINNELFSKDEVDKKIDEMKSEMLKIFNKKYKMHHKTFDKLKRDIAQHNSIINNNTTNNNSHNTTNIQNNNTTNIQNNINIIPLGKEDLINTLSKEDQKRVVNSVFNSIKYLCNITHFNPDTPQYHSFVITNNQNNIAYTYDDKVKQFKAITKEELIHDLIHERGSDIRDFIEYNEEELREGVCTTVKGFIDKLDTDRKYLKKKGNELKALIYSNTRNNDLILNNDKKKIT